MNRPATHILESTAALIRVAVIDPQQAAPPVIRRMFAASGEFACELVDPTSETREQFSVAVIVDGPQRPDAKPGELERIVRHVASLCPSILVLTDRPTGPARRDLCHVCLPVESPFELVRGALLGLAASQPVVQRTAQERGHMRKLSESVNRHIEALDTELRLASRLQRDFLPRGVSTIGSARFATLYRPCSWVSGDIFDIVRLDEQHIGFYLADAVGHGVAAGLLTMYIRHAICMKRIFEGSYDLTPPPRVLSMLNDRLASEEFQDSQFVTMWYGLFNTTTLQLDFSSAGHPPPFLIERHGGCRELYGEGGLLGLISGQHFEHETVQLHPGDRVLVYSDGLDGILIQHRAPLPEMPTLHAGIPELMRLPSDELFASLESQLDSAPGSLSKGDDVSIVLLDVDDPAA